MSAATEWRDVLKPSEATRVAELDGSIEFMREQATILTAEREIIRRRAVGRIRLAAAKNG